MHPRAPQAIDIGIRIVNLIDTGSRISADIDRPLGGQRLVVAARAMLSIAPLGIRRWAGRGRMQELTSQRRREALMLLG